jgi:D-serine deaminase-like pyridoxal phosphate-dependent protein
MDQFNGMDEIRPGNFVFYDLMQYQLGVCSMDEIAVVLACPVTSIHPDRNEVVIYGGAVHLSKEYLNKQNNEKNYGSVVKINDMAWGVPLPDTYVCRISQEHGIIKTSKKLIGQFQIGDLLGVIPVHSCLTANLADFYLTTQNNILHKMHS